jgi:putative ABC transport system permease protein
MQSLLQDLRYGARMLLRAPGFTTVVVVVLALGIGANTAMFSVVNAVLLRPLPFRDPDRLYQVERVNPQAQRSSLNIATLQAIPQRGAIESLGFMHWENATISGPEGAENTFGARVSDGLFSTLGAGPVIGRGFRPDEFATGSNVAVILSHRLWSRRYSRNPNVVGSTILLNGRSALVAGIMPPDFFYHQNFEFWIPWQVSAGDVADAEMRVTAVARLQEGATPEAVQSRIDGTLRNAAPSDFDKGWRARVVSLHEQLTSQFRTSMVVLLGAVAFVLLIACLNVANLLLARTVDRSRELAIRAALGAGRFRATRQMLAESVLLSCMAGTLGLLLGWAGVAGIFQLLGEQRPLPRLDQTRLDYVVTGFTFALALATSVIFGLLPAAQSARTNLIDTLRSGSRGSTSAKGLNFVRNGIIVVETALSVVLLVGAGLMLRSFQRLMSVNPGFQPEHVLTMRLPVPTAITERPRQVAYYARLLDQLQNTRDWNSAGLITPLPLGSVDSNGTFAVEGRPIPAGERQLVRLRAASSGYFRAMGLRLVRGRTLDDTDTAAAPLVAVVSESLAKRYFPTEDPIGKRVSMSTEGKGPWMTVVGVVGDVKQTSLSENGSPEMYRPYGQFLFSPFATSLVVRTLRDPGGAAASLQRRIRAINPDQPINDVYTMTDVIQRSTVQPRLYTALLAVFAMLAIAVAAAGLYGVLSYAVSQRTREIGIRVALGASRNLILSLVVGHAMKVAAGGMVAGLAGSYWLSGLLRSQLYGVQPVDLPTCVVVSGTLLVVAVLAAWIPARRATAVDPNVALRCE